MSYPHRLTANLTAREREQLRAKAKASGRSVSEYVRAAIHEHIETPAAAAVCTETVQAWVDDAAAKMVSRASERSGVSRSEVVRAAIARAMSQP